MGSDETFFDGDQVNLHELYTEKSGLLDGEDEDTEVDLASYAYQIWKNATDADQSLLKTIPDMPNVVYATKTNDESADKEGVIVYTKTNEDNDVLAWINKKGKIITQSQYTILRAAHCTPHTQPLYKIETHHQLVSSAIEYISEDEKKTGGSLGKKTGVKYRTYMRLDRYCKEYDGTLFVNEQLKKAVDDIYKYPLKEYARETLNRQLKAGIADDTLSALVVSLREEDKLCIVNEDELMTNEPHIICSLGLKNL